MVNLLQIGGRAVILETLSVLLRGKVWADTSTLLNAPRCCKFSIAVTAAISESAYMSCDWSGSKKPWKFVPFSSFFKRSLIC